MQTLKKQILTQVLNLVWILISSPLVALACFIVDTNHGNNSFKFWLVECFYYSIGTCLAYLTLTNLVNLYNYYNK